MEKINWNYLGYSSKSFFWIHGENKFDIMEFVLYLRVLFNLKCNGMLLTMKSQLTGQVHSMELNVTEQQLSTYFSGGGLLQNVCPQLTPPEREFIKTGITPEEWVSVFGSGED